MSLMNWNHYIENQHNYGENRLPGRSLLLPADRPGVTHWNYTDSARIIPLNGDWRFRYLPEVPDIPLWDTDTDDTADGWDTLPVPSVWQYHGYGKCVYTNVCYPFDFDPPHINIDNPVGVLRRHFTLPAAGEDDGRLLLRFTGVDNAFFVFVNGAYAGFGKGSRIASEFDITALAHEGDNLLAVLIFTWSDASYLENQDMLLPGSGIFRDVYLVREGAASLWDYTVLPEAGGFRIFPALTGAGASLALSLTDAAGNTVANDGANAVWTPADGESVFLPVAEPHLWSAENPYLYTLVMTVTRAGRTQEIHTKRVGLRFSAVEGNRLTLNGRPLYVKGVNRHDNDPWVGKALTRERLRDELLDIKSANLNSVRTSHYTQQPVFYELASEIGLYIMDEADCESHGAHITGDEGYLNKQPDWFDAFFDRISRAYLQNKNETCVNIRSLGNECGGGDNYLRCGAWLRSQRDVKPITCNGVDFPTDFRETGYMTLDTLASFGPEGKPVLMIEYGHAMGNSPGGLADIWQYVYTHEQAAGGYVWEYKSHGFYREGKDGQPRFLFGGDFGEPYHWSNFSLDGYHTSDGTPKPAWAELRAVSAPVQAQLSEGGVTIRNTYDFTSLSGTVMKWTICADGRSVLSDYIPLPDVPPHDTAFVPLDLSADGYPGLVTLDTVFCRNGAEIGKHQFVLRDTPAEERQTPAFAHRAAESGSNIVLAGDDTVAVLHNGLLTSLQKSGVEQLAGPMQLNLWRAPTDNDGIIGLFPRHAGEWMGCLLQTSFFRARTVTLTDSPEAATVTAVGRLAPAGHYWAFDVTLTYTFTAGGRLTVSASGTPWGPGVPALLPRIGLVLPLTPAHTRAAWLGRTDSYPDRKAASPIGLYDMAVTDMNFRYDVPQETGSHADTCYVTAYGDAGASLTVRMDETAPARFAFSLHDFTLENLTAARHRDELVTSDVKYLYVDAAMRGLGSLSCGPEPEPPYELRSGAFAFTFVIE